MWNDSWLLNVLGHRAAFRIAGFGNLPLQGRCCRNFQFLTLFFLFFGQTSVPYIETGLHPADFTRWDKHALFSFLVRCSRNHRRLPFERDTVGHMQIFAYVWPYLFRIVHVFWTARGCVDGFSFHGLLWSGTEFRHHLPVVLRIHNLLARTCIWRTAGRCCRNSVSDRSRAWKLTPSTHPRVGLGPIFTY